MRGSQVAATPPSATYFARVYVFRGSAPRLDRFLLNLDIGVLRRASPKVVDGGLLHFTSICSLIALSFSMATEGSAIVAMSELIRAQSHWNDEVV